MPGVIRSHRIASADTAEQLRRTVQLIGQGILHGSKYPPLILLAREIAARAPGRKDWAAQLEALFREFLARWRYTKDPHGLETVTSSGEAIHGLTWGAAYPDRRGHGDCDEATAAIGAAAMAIGLPARIVVMAAPRKPGQRGPARASHVYPEIHLPGRGWTPADPVAWPRTPLGQHPRAAWRARFDLNGRPLGGGLQERGASMIGSTEMMDQWAGVGLEAYGLAGIDNEEPLPWSATGIKDFGALADHYGIMSGLGTLAEVEPITADGLARTPILEIGLADWGYVQANGAPYVGMLALGDDGSVYQYLPAPGGVGGFFSKIFGGIKKLGKKVVKGAIGLGKKVLKALPGGKYLLKFTEKMHKLAMKMVKPLMKIVGPLAKKLAPVAALIPGYGPVISVALQKVGTIDKLMKDFGVMQDSKSGKIKFKHPKQAVAFKKALKVKAQQERQRRRAAKQRHPGLIAKGTPEHAAKLQQMGIRPITAPPPRPVRPMWRQQPQANA